MDFFESALWFLVGATSFKAVSYCLSLGYGYMMFKELDKAILNMISAADLDVRKSLIIKYEALKETDIDSEKLKLIRMQDAAVLSAWRDAVIVRILVSVPKSFHKFVEYTNWDEAQKVLQKRMEE